MAVICVNDTLLTTQEFDVVDWEQSLPHDGIPSRGLDTRDHLLELKKNEILQVYYLYKAETDDRIKSYSSGDHFDMMECKADVRIPPRIMPSQPGLPDAALYSIIFGSAFSAIGILMLAYYFKRTKCLRQPFFDRHIEEDQGNDKETTVTKKDGGKSDSCSPLDVFQTGPGESSGTLSPNSMSQVSEKNRLHRTPLSPDSRQYFSRDTTSIESSYQSGQSRGYEPKHRLRLPISSAIRHSSMASEHGSLPSKYYPEKYNRERRHMATVDSTSENDLTDDAVQNESDTYDSPETRGRFNYREVSSPSLRNKPQQHHRLSVNHERQLVSRPLASPLQYNHRALHIRGRHQRRATLSHPFSSSIKWSDFELESDNEISSEDHFSVDSQQLHDSCPKKNHQSAILSENRTGMNVKDEHNDDGCSSSLEGGSVVESGASFYSKQIRFSKYRA